MKMMVTKTCESRKHPSYEAATMALYVMSQRNLKDNLGRKLDTTKMEVKKCLLCKGWHVRKAR